MQRCINASMNNVGNVLAITGLTCLLVACVTPEEGTSVTPVSQFYFQQAYANVAMGQWKRITPDYGDMVLGYFGRTPVPADPEIIKKAEKQRKKPVFDGDPLDLPEPGIPRATKILEENNLPVNDENIFIIASCDKKGLEFLLGESKINVRKIETTGENKEKELVN